ncbi:MAG: hypothetical protein QF733_00845 [Phycisphaerales bacterium]|jgi:hypothetical protein|nr:hypothetical protein [Phycisphaerales bacterium]
MTGRAGGGFLLVLALTVGSSVAPASWISWTGDVADVVRAPIMPISRIGVSVASWLRPPRDVTGRPVDEMEIDQLRRDRDRFEQMWQAQRVRADDLARRLRQLEGLPEDALRSPHRPLVVEAEVTGRSPADPRSPIELRMPREGGERLEVGDIAVWNGHRVLGRLSHVAPLRLMVLPISNPESGPIEVVSASASGERLPRMLLRQEGRGMLVADVDKRFALEPGTRLLLADARWPAWAYGMEVAVVESIHPLDEAPLRQRVTARPAVDGPAVARVVVLSADPEALP